MITDHSSAGFEYLLLDRPLVRIHVPELIEKANVHADYVRLLAEVARAIVELHDQVDRHLAQPRNQRQPQLVQ